jgi:hypothetical protein
VFQLYRNNDIQNHGVSFVFLSTVWLRRRRQLISEGEYCAYSVQADPFLQFIFHRLLQGLWDFRFVGGLEDVFELFADRY